ncbi:MAG: hypothetical protein M3537_07460 [Chloroflexota bacterium]|nr:hypothetical protein [Chloroflexota bacterium]
MADFSVDTNIHGGPIGPVTGSVLADVTSELAGLDNMKLTLAGGTKTTLAGENTVHSDAELTLAPVTTTSTIDVKPVTTTASVDTTSNFDLKPVAVDSCVRLELAPPPATEISTPYETTWSWSVLGLELFALSVSGRTSTHVRPERPDPLVIDL